MSRSAPLPGEQTPDAAAQATLIDASALIALLGAEPAAAEVQELLRQGGALMTTLNLAEAVDRLQRRYGLEMEEIRPVIEGLLHKSLDLLSLDAATAWRAGELRAKHYHRSRCPISLADAVLVASTPPGGQIATSDAPVVSIATSEDLSVIRLLDSHGRRPSRTADSSGVAMVAARPPTPE
jgi:PIN domain nuclease of toxin-antitoxin system